MSWPGKCATRSWLATWCTSNEKTGSRPVRISRRLRLDAAEGRVLQGRRPAREAAGEPGAHPRCDPPRGASAQMGQSSLRGAGEKIRPHDEGRAVPAARRGELVRQALPRAEDFE